MKKAFILTVVLLFTGICTVFSQESNNLSDGALLDGKNIVKVNLTSLSLRNFGFYGERIINNRFSAILGVSFIPKGGIPFLNTSNLVENDNNGVISNVKFNSLALIPELRIYTGSGYGKGFYFAPYFKYEQFGLDNVSAKFTDNSDVERQIIMDGKLKTYSGGLMIGYQWLIGKNKNFVIDWSILGIHAGKSSGNIHGFYANGTLSTQDQEDVKNNIDDTLNDIPLIKHETTVDSKNANVDISGPWAFFRMGVSVGYRF